MYTHVHTYTHISIYTYMYIRMRACVRTLRWVSEYIDMYTYTLAQVCLVF